MKKRLKLPNGFGSVVYYGDSNRRKPYLVKKTISGHQKIIGQFATYEKGLAFLVEYNKNPSLFSPSLITFSEVYDLMAAERFPKLAKTTCANYVAAYKHCQPLYRKKFAELKIGDLQQIIRNMSAAGRNRAVPISRKVLPYFRYWMERPGKTLIADDKGQKLTYHKFRSLFDKVMTATRCKHTPHECRHTCATMLDNAGANETAVKRILGHASQGVTKGVYTHKSLHELKRAIDLI